jgi:hypothetical protein
MKSIVFNGSGLENREYGRRDPSRWPRGTLYPQKLALTSPISGGLSVGIVNSRTQATMFSFMCCHIVLQNVTDKSASFYQPTRCHIMLKYEKKIFPLLIRHDVFPSVFEICSFNYKGRVKESGIPSKVSGASTHIENQYWNSSFHRSHLRSVL